ncbi:hypothetical protein D3C79_767980 [compost metagenome]
MRQSIWSNGVAPHMACSVRSGPSRLRSERAWVGDVWSPFTAPCGVGISRIGTIGVPSRRSSTYRLPCLVGTMIAGFMPSLVFRWTSVGWLPTSMSHRSWWVNW